MEIQGAGISGIVAAGRGDVMQMDHYVLSKDEAALAGVPIILTICDVATRYTEFEAAECRYTDCR